MAETAVSFLVNQLTPFLQEETRLLRGVREEVEHIKDELEQMREVIRGVDEREDADPHLKIWVKRLRDVAYDAEDVLDEFRLQVAHRHNHGFCGFLNKIVLSIKKLKARHKIALEIRRLKSTVEKIFQSFERYRNLGHVSNSLIISHTSNDGRDDALLLEEAELEGIEKPKEKLISWLLDGDSQRKVVSVVGMGGLGKTTLVKKVFENEQIKRRFQSHVWITVSRSFDIVELLKTIIRLLYHEIKQAPPEIMHEDDLKVVIKEFLQERRYVVVLDDVWSIGAWDDIKYALPNNDFGSRVLLTTRKFDVADASHLESHGHLHEMKALSDSESWTLFCNKTFQGKCCPPHLEDLSRNILRKCEGLPLAVVAIGGVLALKDKNRVVWEMVQRNLGAEPEGDEKIHRVNKILSLSYYDLPYYLKICFLYLCMFPEDYMIEKGRVIKLWSAEGFVQEIARKTREEVAESYFNELANRSLIQITYVTRDEKYCRCRVHDLLREMIISKSREQNIATLASDVVCEEKVRRLAIHNSMEKLQETKCLKRIRSMIFFGEPYRAGNFPLSLILSGGSKLLKVLDLRDAPLDRLPDDVFELLHLRYLSMYRTNVKVLPKNIGKLLNLETLDLRDTHVTELPAEIGMLQKLRYLLGGFYPGFKAPPEIGKLSCLQELKMVQANDNNGNQILKEVGKLTQLRKLFITEVRRDDGMTLCSSIEKLSNLRSLHLESPNEYPEIVDLQSLSSSHHFLKTLVLVARLEMLPQWISSLHSLVRVKLNRSGLRDEQLQCLQELPNLLYLALSSAYDGVELCFKDGGFRRLKLLEISYMKALRWVRVQLGTMPQLVTLDILGCQLEELPSGIEHLTNLQSLDLSYIPHSLAETLRKRDSEHEDYLKISHIPHVWIQSQNEDGFLMAEDII